MPLIARDPIPEFPIVFPGFTARRARACAWPSSACMIAARAYEPRSELSPSPARRRTQQRLAKSATWVMQGFEEPSDLGAMIKQMQPLKQGILFPI